MESEEFETLLKKAGLNKSQFAKLTGLNRVTVTNWRPGEKNRNNPPEWTRSWLEMYVKVLECDKLINAFNAAQKAQS